MFFLACYAYRNHWLSPGVTRSTQSKTFWLHFSHTFKWIRMIFNMALKQLNMHINFWVSYHETREQLLFYWLCQEKKKFHLMSQEQTCLVSNIVWNDGALGTAIHTCEPICFTLGMMLHLTTLYRRGVLSDHSWSHTQQQVILMRLPTDHNQLNAHLN